jgi:hypothetical protein
MPTELRRMLANACSALGPKIFCELEQFRQSQRREKNSSLISLFMKATIPGTHSFRGKIDVTLQGRYKVIFFSVNRFPYRYHCFSKCSTENLGFHEIVFEKSNLLAFDIITLIKS